MFKKVLITMAVLFLATLVCVGTGAAADTSGLPTWGTVPKGTYELTDDVQLISELTIANDVTIDLNGHTITAAKYKRLFTVFPSGNFTLTDNSVSGGGKLTGGSADEGSGCGVYVDGGKFTMKGGSITGCSADGSGGGVYVESGTFTMSGGSITGCTANSNGGGVCVFGGTFTMSGDAKIIGCEASDFGGGVYVSDGTFTMEGGSIGGTTEDDACTADCSGGGVFVDSYGTFTMEDGSITGSTATWGGGGVSIYEGEFTMSDGSITGCSATMGDGGGVYVDISGTFTMSCGSITDCTATGDGGGVYVSSGEFTMEGGSITGCTATSMGGGGVFVGGTFTMSGGSITGCSATMDGGGVYFYGGTFNISGNALVEDAVHLYTGSTITLTGAFDTSGTYGVKCITLEGGAADWVAKTIVTGSDTVKAGEYAGYFTLSTDPAYKGYGLFPSKNNLVFGQAVAKIGEKGYETVAAAFAEAKDKDIITLLKDSTLGGEITVDKTVTLDLNGQTLTAYSGNRLFTVSTGGNFTLTDTNKTAKHYFTYVDNGVWTKYDGDINDKTVVSLADFNLTEAKAAATGDYIVEFDGGILTGGSADYGGAVFVSGGKFTMEGGSITGCGAGVGGGASSFGGGVSVNNNGTFTMESGSIAGCSAENGGGVYIINGETGSTTFTMKDDAEITGCSAKCGGGVFVGGTFTMEGGSITGCTATSMGGGGVFVGGTFTMSGGSITGCTALWGGGVYVSGGTFEMSGGSITGCSADYGGGVYVSGKNGKFTMKGGSITDCSAENNSGGVYVEGDGTFTMSGGTIGGTTVEDACTSSKGGGVYVSGGTFEMSGGSITGCTAKLGGAVYVNSGTFTMNSGSISGCSAKHGGGVCVFGGTFTMSGGSITGCEARDYGGGVCVFGGTFTMEGGSITGCEARAYGGGVYVDDGEFTMSGGTIGGTTVEDACTSSNGGGVYVNGGEFTMEGGSITGCSAEYGGGVCVFGGTFTMSGGSITDCSATGNGGGVCVFGGTFNISGTALVAENNNVYLKAGKTITLTDAFTETNPTKAGVKCITLQGGVEWEKTNSVVTGSDTAKAGEYAGYFTLSTELTAAEYKLFPSKNNLVFGQAVAKIDDTEYATVADAFDAAENGQTITLLKDSTLSGEITVDKPVTLDLNGKTLTAADSNRLFSVSSDGNFTLTDNSVSGGGKLTGGGVCVDGGEFNMTGGSINECSAYNGGGVRVNSEGTFTMSGDAKITGCTADGSGGGVYVSGGTFTMEDGSITECSATYGGGGVYVNSGTFTMSGGTIGGPEADDACTATWYGGGVFVDGGEFTMEGGSITGCSAENSGGGVYVSSGEFTMSGGTIGGPEAEDACTADSGGGVYVFGGTFNVSGSADVSGNTDSENENNVYLETDDALTLAGDFTGSIGISYAGAEPAEGVKFGVVTSGTGAEHFIADNDGNTGTLSGTDLVWSTSSSSITVTFDKNNGDGSMDPQVMNANEETQLNKNTFTRTGFNFSGWALTEEGDAEYADEAKVTLSEDTTLYAVWTESTPEPTPTPTPGPTPEPIPTPTPGPTPKPASGSYTGGSSDSGSGNYSEYYRTTDGNGGTVSFGSSTIVKSVELPAGVKGEVILRTKTSEKGPEGKETRYVFEIEIRNYPDGTPGKIIYQLPLSEIEMAGNTPADYILMHKDSDTQWAELPTTYEITGTKAVYTAVTTAFSPFAIVYAEGGAKPAGGDAAVVEQTAVSTAAAPTAAVTAAPAAVPTAVKTEAPVQTEAPKSPLALGGILAGLAAAAVLGLGRRE